MARRKGFRSRDRLRSLHPSRAQETGQSDARAIHAAESGDLRQAETALRDSERALNRYDTEIEKTVQTIARQTKDPELAKYYSAAGHFYEQESGTSMPAWPPRKEDAAWWTRARQSLPFKDWYNTKYKVGGVDEKTGK